MSRLTRTCLGLAGAVILLSLAGGPRGKVIIAPQVETVEDVIFARAPKNELKLDIAWPKNRGPYPIIVYFHGGGWTLGDKSMFRHRMHILAQTGYVVFNANYRLSPEARFPAAVNDALAAVIFAKEKAGDYNGDSSKVAVMGDSAGAHLAAMAALVWDDPYFQPTYPGKGKTTAQVQAAVLMYGMYRLNWVMVQDPRIWGFVITKPMVLAFMGATLESKPEDYEKASPASYLGRPDLPPMFILCGTQDALYPESVWLNQALDKKGSNHLAYFVEGAEHEFNFLENREDFPYLHAILDFLDEELKKK
jgi:acetyl esterase/lipase